MAIAASEPTVGLQEKQLDDPVAKVTNFAVQAEALQNPLDFDQFSSLAGSFGDLLRSNLATYVIDREMKALAADPRYIGPEATPQDYVSVSVGESWSLGIRRVAPNLPPTTKMLSTNTHLMFGFLAVASPVDVEQFSMDPLTVSDVFDPALRLTRGRSLSMSRGDVYIGRAGDDVHRVAPMASGALCLVLQSADAVPYRWEFDVETLRPTTMLPADPENARLCFVIRYLATTRDPSSLASIHALTDHSDHVVRWTAVRGVMALSAAAGQKLLSRSLTDSHPHIRAAARRSIEVLPSESEHGTHA